MTADGPEGLHGSPLIKGIVWVSFWVGQLGSLWFDRAMLEREGWSAVLFAAVYMALSFSTVVFFVRARRWARTTYAAFCWMAIGALVAGPEQAGLQTAFGVVSLAVDIWLLWLVWTQPLSAAFVPGTPTSPGERALAMVLAYLVIAISALISYGSPTVWQGMLVGLPLLALGIVQMVSLRRPRDKNASA